MRHILGAMVCAASVAMFMTGADAQQVPRGAAAKRAKAPAADETGMHGIHEMRKVGRKTCFVDHFHSGSGSGASKREAEVSAIGSWEGFTGMEYGGSWGSWRTSEAKTMQCDRGGLGGAWACSISSIPCRPF